VFYAFDKVVGQS